MHRHLVFPLLLASVSNLALAGTAPPKVDKQSWSCMTAADAQTRKLQVEQGMLPNVVFSGEDQKAGIEARMVKYKTPALSVAVIRGGKLDWSTAWGKLQHDGAHADCATLFQAGSLSKPVTVLGAMRIKQQGLIDFDRNIEAYLSSYHLPQGKQSDANPVTLRNLLTHTSGLTPGGYQGYAQGQPLPTDVQTVMAEPPSNARKVEVSQAPNGALRYSGGGYTVAEIALQDRLGKPFDQIMETWLTRPVGMREATFTIPLAAAHHARTARGHRADGSAVAGGWHNHPEQAAAGLWATPSDMAAFLIEVRKAWLGKSRIFTQEAIRELLAKPIEGHAYGFRLSGEGEQLFITHYGGTVGYNAGMTINLHTGNGAVYMCNSENGPGLGGEFLSAVSRVYGWPQFREVQVTRVSHAVEALNALTGNYAFPDQGPVVEVAYDKDALTLVFPNGDRYAMAAIKGLPLEFIHPDTAVRASFERKGSDMLMQLYGQTARRLPHPK